MFTTSMFFQRGKLSSTHKSTAVRVDIKVSGKNKAVDICKQIINNSVANELIENFGALI